MGYDLLVYIIEIVCDKVVYLPVNVLLEKLFDLALVQLYPFQKPTAVTFFDKSNTEYLL